MPTRVLQVDAFTHIPFAGNPAAVCVLPRPADERWMRAVAGEMNLSETAFLHREDDGFRLRWFTPAVEVDLCGHATLASAHVLWADGHLPAGVEARFHTRSGLLTARQAGEWIEMDFPAETARPVEAPAELRDGLGVPMSYVGRNRMDYLVEVESESVVRSLHPDLRRLGALPARGIIVTARASSADYDYVSRFFGPAAGIDEDPVTGSAHCCLGPYWSAKVGRAALVGYQASARGGVVRTRVEGDRVMLGGRAVTVLVGDLV